jgi:ubiquinone/menaquinone biosynthesis C-methylase UbiE
VADYQHIYDHRAEAYDALVEREDHAQNLAAALREIAPFEGLDVVETGAGTGRVTRMLAPSARSVRAFDRTAHMLSVAEARARALGHASVRFEVASHAKLPVETASADLAIEGWAFGHAVGWNPSAWVAEVDAHVQELARTVREGGLVVLIETMGTGVEAPFEGGHALVPFHHHLVDVLRFSHRCVRTDYAFEDADEAAERMGHFFGERMAVKVRAHAWRVVPEFTGIYWRAARP